MKKEIKVVAIVLVALIVFLGGFGLGASKGIKITIDGDLKLEGGAANVGATVAPTAQPTTQAPTTQAPTTQAPTDAPSGGDDTTAPTQAAPSGDAKIPSTKAEIAAAYNKAVNGTKNYTGAVHVKKDSTIAIQITDCPGGDAVKKIVQPVVDKFAGSSTKEFDYNNGVAVDDANRKLFDHITPGGREAKLTEAGIANATATPAGDGYKMTITLVAEKSSFDGTNTVNPVNHESIMDPLNLATLDADPITITAADMDYPGATVEATVDGEGRLTTLSIKMPLDGSGTGKAAFITATIGLAGSLDDLYTFTY
ncbi:MAG: hypothetical protein IJW86_05085 [Clostridia bacterium]|nr:hypothetical protein [Clostridia bacterium]